MLRIDRMTDYAAVVLARMRQHGGPLSATALSAQTGLPLSTVARVMKLLVGAGFAASTRGRNGGYEALPIPVSILEVVEAFEGPIAISPCVPDGGKCCAAMAVCPSRGQWNEINERIKALLGGCSVDTLTISKDCSECSC